MFDMTSRGVIFRAGKWYARVWSHGCEWGYGVKGGWYLFPWHPLYRRRE